MSRPLVATIDQNALRANLEHVRSLTSGQHIWAVVKADAYGHGLDRVLPGLAGADGLALVEVDRALQIRAQYPEKPVLLLEGAFDEASTQLAVTHQLDLVVHDESQLRWLESLAGPRSLRVWLKFNGGMNRLGFTQSGFRQAFERLFTCVAIDKIGLMMHFANADQADGIAEAMLRFERATEGLPGQRCVANSAGLHDATTHIGWVRPGVMLYGGSPFGHRSAKSLGLAPVMSLNSAIIGTQSLLPGDSVGYGSTFKAGRPMRVGVVAVGYGDGYPRAAGTGTPVWVAGRRTRTVGRVSMDLITIDLDPVPEAGVGTPVQLWGEHISIDDVAQAADTIGYELMCRLARRVPVQIINPVTAT